MHIRTFSLPSVIQSQSSDLINVSRDQISGLKIREGEEEYIIGDLALTEGKNPYKAINSSVEDLDYRLLSKAALLTAARSEEHTSNSSHVAISYAVFCLKKKKNDKSRTK